MIVAALIAPFIALLVIVVVLIVLGSKQDKIERKRMLNHLYSTRQINEEIFDKHWPR